MAEEIIVTHIAGEVLRISNPGIVNTHIAGEILRSAFNEEIIVTYIAGEVLRAPVVETNACGNFFLLF